MTKMTRRQFLGTAPLAVFGGWLAWQLRLDHLQADSLHMAVPVAVPMRVGEGDEVPPAYDVYLPIVRRDDD